MVPIHCDSRKHIISYLLEEILTFLQNISVFHLENRMDFLLLAFCFWGSVFIWLAASFTQRCVRGLWGTWGTLSPTTLSLKCSHWAVLVDESVPCWTPANFLLAVTQVLRAIALKPRGDFICLAQWTHFSLTLTTTKWHSFLSGSKTEPTQHGNCNWEVGIQLLFISSSGWTVITAVIST